MARLHPAKPKTPDSTEERILRLVETGLDDHFLVLHGGVVGDLIVILHPEHGAIAVLPVDGHVRWDADLDAYIDDNGTETDPSAASRRATAALAAAGWRLPVAFWIVLGDSAPTGPARPEVLFADALREGFGQRLLADAPPSAPGTGSVATFFAALAPDAQPYEPGQITPAQARWRMENGVAAPTPVLSQSSAIPEPPAAPLVIPVPPSAEFLVSAPSPRGMPDGLSGPVPVATPPALPPPNPLKRLAMIKMIELCVENLANSGRQNAPIFVLGVQVKPSDVTDPQFLLPALLIAAAETWTPVVVRKGGIGGFHMRFRRNSQTLLGYDVVDIDPAAPFLLFLSISHFFRTSLTNGEYNLDDMIQTYARWLERNGLNTELIEDIDVNIALKMINA